MNTVLSSLAKNLKRPKDNAYEASHVGNKLLLCALLLLLFSAVCLILMILPIKVYTNTNVSRDCISRYAGYLKEASEIGKRFNLYTQHHAFSQQDAAYAETYKGLVSADLSDTANLYGVGNISAEESYMVANEAPTPPVVRVTGIAFNNEKSVACMDIGDSGNLNMHVGDSFDNGKGKIIKIQEKGVYWTWRNQKYFTGL